LTTTVKQWLLNAKSSQVHQSEARILLSHCLQKPREWLIAHDEALLPEAVQLRAMDLLHRRQAGEPIAYLVGQKEFYGRAFLVSPAVLIPRPETELLIDTVIELMMHRTACRVLDLGTGSGCIGITLALEKPDWTILATDVSSNSLEIAQRNALQLQAPNIRFLQGSWWSAVAEDQQFDLIVSNPPYIRNDDHHLLEGDLRFEPRQALTDEQQDGLSAYRSLVGGLVNHPPYLAQQGWIVMEHGFDQASSVAEIFRQTGRFETQTRDDLAGQPRLIVAKRSSAR
jgi:release factor glutamine methyltransferase